MGNSNSVSNRNDIETNILQASNNTCEATYSVVSEGNTFIAGGDINASQQITQSFACTVTNTFDATIINSITDTIKQTASVENGLILPSIGFNDNSSSVNDNVRNTISQITNNTCIVNKSSLAEGNFYMAGGSITQNQSIIGGTTDSCTMNNIMSAAAANTLVTTETQTASVTNAITTIVIVIAICATISAVGVQAFSKAPVMGKPGVSSLSSMSSNLSSGISAIKKL